MTPRQVKKLRKVISTPCYYRERAIALAEELADLQVERSISQKHGYSARNIEQETTISRLHEKLRWYIDRL